MSQVELNAILSERIDMGPELAIFRVVPQGREFSDFNPGQFTTLALQGKSPRCAGSATDTKPLEPEKFIQRAYSIASPPGNKNYMEFYLTLVKNGVLTPRLWSLKAGDPLFLSPKITGNFVMDEVPADQNIVFVATGTGIAPYMSMLGTFLRPDQPRQVALFHGVRQSQDLGYRSECLIMEKLCPHFHYFPIISRPQLDPVPWKGPMGHVQNLWQSGSLEKIWGFKPTSNNTHIFLCGSPAMIDGMIELLNHEGFKEHKKTEPGQIHVERYW